ncbi:Melanoma-associated antigen 8 [Tupaia chinensis]|uniref:Melanoma-associated antigen 8 n=2 Tax=Tupaia chinensis TaxID=246437 RepID=L8YFN2_TUPCH|nr:Melanoma-associated antigen 8 [Tupaia chinensis]
MADTPWSQSDEGSSSEDQGPRIRQDPAGHVSLLRRALYKKMVDLVLFLLHKYQVKEPITEEELLNSVIQDYQDYFLVIFNEASEYLQLIFGIEVKEVDPTSHSYVLVTILGLTYDGMLSDNQTMPKTGLLAIILGVIFMEGNPTPEEEIWEALNMMGIYTGREHFIFGEPRKLLTEEWVQENYLE